MLFLLFLFDRFRHLGCCPVEPEVVASLWPAAGALTGKDLR